MRFLHAADLHIDSPLRGLATIGDEPADEVRSAPRRAMERLVRTAIDRQVDLVVLAGDLFDGDTRDVRTGLFLARCLGELAESGIPVVLVSGNHDAESEISRSLRLPNDVHHLSAAAVDRRRFDDLGVEVIGRSYPDRDPPEGFVSGYPVADPGLFTIGLLHTCLTGNADHLEYAPCSLDDLRSRRYDYWALGHIHNREVVSTEPWVVFPGNLQGRHARETGPKGASLVEVVDGRVESVEHLELDVVRWHRVTVTLDASITTVDEALDAMLPEVRAVESGARPSVVRVELVGTTPAHQALAAAGSALRADVQSAVFAQRGLWIEKVRVGTRAPASDTPPVDEDTVGKLVTRCSSLDAAATRTLIADELAALRARLGAIDLAPAGLSLDDDAWLVERTDAAAGLLTELLGDSGTS